MLGLGGLSLLLLAVLFIVRVEGEPLIDVGKIAPFFPWNVFFILVVLFPLANAISSDVVGLNAIISSGVSALLNNMPTALIMATVIFLAAYITNFANNMIICALFVTIVCFIRDSLPIHPEILSYLVVLSSSLSMFFPAANPINASSSDKGTMYPSDRNSRTALSAARSCAACFWFSAMSGARSFSNPVICLTHQ